MNTREVMQQALEALDSDNPDIQLRAAIALQIALKTEQREWVGLTEDEAFACRGRDYFETYKAIEAQLKEKNT